MTALSQKSIHNINRIDKKSNVPRDENLKRVFEVGFISNYSRAVISNLSYPDMGIEMIENLTR